MARCTLVIIRSFEHHADDCMFWFCSTPNQRENTLEVVRGLPPTSRDDLQFDGYLKYPLANIHLQTSMPSLGFEPRPYGTTDRITVV
ncbi:hypothetical protein TNCV_3144981 [Trichonephila clavipes]|nr:hypothetical protein TNCV_3144981 [Trichonephila clavipes]